MEYAEELPAGFELLRLSAAHSQVACWIRDGNGPSLVFVHGNSSSKRAFRDLLLTPELAQRRAIAMDLPGSGESDDASDAQYNIPAFARTLREVVGTLAPERAIVVGWSLGGHIALEAAGQAPDAIRALVLTGTPPSGPGMAEVAATFHPSELMAVTAGESPPPELLVRYVRALYGHTRPIARELFAAARRCHGRMRRVFAEHWMSGTEGFRQRDVIATWPHPVAVIQGVEEPFFDPSIVDQMQWKNLWGGRSQYIAGTGHAPFYEDPQSYGSLLAQFVRQFDE